MAERSCGVVLRALAFAILVGAWGTAHAQRTDENAITAAEDAFGTTVGRESIGIYDSGNVRGFSPSTAGNIRIEGLYFDSQGGVTSRINDGETIHVGPSAQGFAFPAPTGVVDLSLRGSGDRLGVSPLVSTSSFGGFGLEADGQVPLGDGLSASVGAGFFRNKYGSGGGSTRWNVGVVPHWELSPNVELKAFYSREQTYRDTSQGVYIPQGDYVPQRIVRARYPGPDFLLNDYYSQAFGVLGKASLGSWTVRGGVFRSMYIGDVGYSNIISVGPDGRSTTRFANAFPANAYLSWSGEFRVSRKFVDGPRQHLITVSLRGRSLASRYGDGVQTDLGAADLNSVIQATRPAYIFGQLIDDKTDQVTGGVAYSLNWNGLGEVTVGAQRTRYIKQVDAPGLPSARGVTEAWLPTFSAAVPVTKRIALYGSYVRGLEDSGIAPGFATNANAVLPANRTRQIDVGVKVSLPVKTTVILGYFDIEKPYIDLNTTGLFGVLGTQRNRGLEVSLTSSPTSRLTIVAGGVLSWPRVSASPAIADPIGARPIAQPDARAQLNVNYQLPFAPKLAIDAYLNHESSSAGTVNNAVIIPGSTRFGGGLRYNFNVNKSPFTLRLSIFNVGNVYRLIPIGSGVYVYNNSTNISAYLTADF